MNTVFGILIVVSLVVVFFVVRLRGNRAACPSCGGDMIPDHTKFRYTVEWECVECGKTIETLREQRRIR